MEMSSSISIAVPKGPYRAIANLWNGKLGVLLDFFYELCDELRIL